MQLLASRLCRLGSLATDLHKRRTQHGLVVLGGTLRSLGSVLMDKVESGTHLLSITSRREFRGLVGSVKCLLAQIGKSGQDLLLVITLDETRGVVGLLFGCQYGRLQRTLVDMTEFGQPESPGRGGGVFEIRRCGQRWEDGQIGVRIECHLCCVCSISFSSGVFGAKTRGASCVSERAGLDGRPAKNAKAL